MRELTEQEIEYVDNRRHDSVNFNRSSRMGTNRQMSQNNQPRVRK